MVVCSKTQYKSINHYIVIIITILALLFITCFPLQIKNCDRCQRNTSESKCYDMLHPVKVVAKVWYLVGIDLIDAGKVSGKGNQYLLTMTDYFSKYVEAIPLPVKSALSVAKGLSKVYCRHGAPAHIISDQGREFVNQVRLWLRGLVEHRTTLCHLCSCW